MLLADGKATRGCGVADGAGWRTGDPTTRKQGKRLQRTLASPHAPPAEAEGIAMHFPRWPKRIWSFQVVGFIQDANPGRGDDPDRAISPAACIAVMRRKRHAGQPSAEPCGVTRAGRGMHHAGVVLDQKRCAFAEAALALHATFRAEWEILATDGFAPTKVGPHQSSISDEWIRADQGRHPAKQQPEWVTAASARTSTWRSRHGRRPGARSPASRTDRTGG